PVSKDNPAIKSGLAPEQNATLRLFNWVAYINPDCLKAFGKRYNCKVEVTTFQNMDAALAKLRSGQLNFDVFFPTVDVMAQLVYGKLIQPLNHSYIPNISQAWPDFTNPIYDGKWQYTVPYTISTTGIGYWFPPDGRGPVANDTITVLKGAPNPVLAHLFLNYMLDFNNAMTNISFNGYMQPINGVTPQRLVKEQILPPSLMSTAVLPS